MSAELLEYIEKTRTENKMLPAILLILVMIFFIGTLVIYDLSFHVTPKKTGAAYTPMKGKQYVAFRSKTLELLDKEMQYEYEPVSITSFDGLKLCGKLYVTDKTAPFQILMHGYRGVAERDFCGGLNHDIENGHNVLLIDERGHGRSDGHSLTMGVLERRDCLSWAEYLCERYPDCKIILTGISMGAATVLMASELSMPENVVGIIADCGYTSPKEIIKLEIKKMRLPVKLTYPLVRLVGKIYAHFDLEECSAVEAVKKTKLPILFIHGESDHYVPCYMSVENYNACASEKTLLTVPGAGHGLSFMVDFPKYSKAVSDFVYKTTGYINKI